MEHKRVLEGCAYAAAKRKSIGIHLGVVCRSMKRSLERRDCSAWPEEPDDSPCPKRHQCHGFAASRRASRLLTYHDIARLHLGDLAESLPFAELTRHPDMDELLHSLQPPPGSKNRENLLAENGKVCKGCRGIFATSEIRKSYCRTCGNSCTRNRARTPRGILLQLITSCRAHDGRSGRSCDLTEQNVLAAFRCQGGLCYYSNAPLCFEFASQFRISIERIDNTIGHVVGNVVLVCLCFQSADMSKHSIGAHGAQWSRQKFFEAKRLRHSTATHAVAFQPKERSRRESKTNEEAGGKYKCAGCGTFHDPSSFNRDSSKRTGLRSLCKPCERDRDKRRDATLARILQTRRKSAKHRAKQEGAPFGLDRVEVLQDMWNVQSGRGYYTQIPLGHVPFENWVVSIERFKKEHGYVSGNICLEVFEANTQKQWSTEFADAVWGVAAAL